MADQIGVARKWLQSPGNHGEHFDICKSKRAKAVRLGAIEITLRDCARRCSDRRGAGGKAAYFSPAPNIPSPPSTMGLPFDNQPNGAVDGSGESTT